MSKALLSLISAYKAIFNTKNGDEVLDDLRKLAQIDEQAGSSLSHSECAYRNGMQDMYRYIEAMLSENE
tara:strand:- start:328 stop:534 length:207 start_codon:yes stop_codon:yes gene_type:complete